jgi:hypothetical protein
VQIFLRFHESCFTDVADTIKSKSVFPKHENRFIADSSNDLKTREMQGHEKHDKQTTTSKKTIRNESEKHTTNSHAKPEMPKRNLIAK